MYFYTFSLVINFLSSIQDAKNSLYFITNSFFFLPTSSSVYGGEELWINFSICSKEAGEP